MRSVAPLLVYTEQPNQGLLTPAYPACATYPPAHGCLSLERRRCGSGAAGIENRKQYRPPSRHRLSLGGTSDSAAMAVGDRFEHRATQDAREERLVFSRIRG